MQSPTPQTPDTAKSDGAIEEVLRTVVAELRATREGARRQARRTSAMAVVLGVALAALGWSVSPTFSRAEVPGEPRGAMSTASPQERAESRARLIGMLPADKQRELATFEREVAWLDAYMKTWDEGTAAAVVAIMLFRMSQSMSTMPSMDQQMRTMSGQMSTLPAIVAELAQMNAKLGVITASMDSTMGRAGRMMPWMPFSP